MITDPVPRAARRKAQYERSDALRELVLPSASVLKPLADGIEAALQADGRAAVEEACNAFAQAIAHLQGLAPPEVVVLGTRPHRTQSGVCIYEKFGDYDLTTARIRVWMRTAMRRQVSSAGSFIHTLCHELCHHTDVVGLRFADTPHTRGFYERAAILYHQARGTPRKPLIWVAGRGGRYRLDWQRTMRG